MDIASHVLSPSDFSHMVLRYLFIEIIVQYHIISYQEVKFFATDLSQRNSNIKRTSSSIKLKYRYVPVIQSYLLLRSVMSTLLPVLRLVGALM